VTGVKASIDENGGLVLTADDGRDIVLTAADAVTEQLFNGGTVSASNTDLSGGAFIKTGDLTVSAQDSIVFSAPTGRLDATPDDDNVQAVGTIANADITTVAAANITMESVDSALAQIDSFRADLGAIQNRFESTIRNLSAVSESLADANSRIKDADFATDSAELSKNQVLQQAGISVLDQANALPKQALSLLG